MWSNDFTADEIKEKQELLSITENLLGGFNDSYKNLLNLEDNDGKKTINTLKKIALFLKDKKDFTDMPEYIVSKDFNEKLVDEFDITSTKQIISFFKKYLIDKSKLDDLFAKLAKYKDYLVYKKIIDLYSALLTEEQKKQLE